MLSSRYGSAMKDYQQRREQTRKSVEDYANSSDHGQVDVIYRFGESMIDERGIQISCDRLHVPGYEHDVVFDKANPWEDMSR